MLNQRLQACAAWITDGKTVCDVGTDHAYLAAELLRKERCQHVIASDIGEGPLQAARRTLEQAGLLQRATLLLSDGLEQVDKTDVSHVVIAGMGGETIIHILQPCDWVKQGVQLILQPMTKVPVLRQWLAENGYAILQEQVVKDGKFFYNLLRVQYDGVVRTLTRWSEKLACRIGAMPWYRHMAEENENACKRLQSRFRTAIRQWQRIICRLLQNLTADYSRNLSESN